MARYSYAKEQARFIDDAMVKLPKHWAIKARAKYDALAKKSVKTANLYLIDLLDAIKSNIDIGASDDDLVDLACELTRKVRMMQSEHLTRGGISKNNCAIEFYADLEKLSTFYGVRYPSEFDRNDILARFTCSSWWLRRLRIVHAKQAEAAAINAGLVHKHANMYCSDDTLKRRNDQLKRNAETLENIKLANQSTGEIITLATAANAGLANTYNRASELITRTKGFQDLSRKYNHHCVFLTITTPSRMHAVTSDGKPNPKYNGTKPDEAQRYLVECWARVRAKLARHVYENGDKGLKFYGLRVVEPHHDGTPHWHASIWYKHKDDLQIIKDAVLEHFLHGENCDGNEQGARENRVLFKECDERGAVGYMLKYILKNMKGLGIDGEKSDEGSIDSEEGTSRVEAWAATWRIRQFQQVGGHSVTVWREFRRVDKEDVLPKFYWAWLSAQRVEKKHANYAEFVEAMGGLETKPKESIFKVEYDFINGRGAYGDTILKKVKGVIGNFFMQSGEARKEIVKTNRGEWVTL